MTTENDKNLNRLLSNWPAGTVAVQSWLTEQGISQNLTNWYLKSGWVESVGRGAYKKPGDNVDWPGGLYAIQQHLKRNIHLGAKSALEMLGMAHYIRLGTGGNYYFFGDQQSKMPLWFINNHSWTIQVNYFATGFLSDNSFGLITHSIDGIPITLSSAERAILELFYLVPQHQTLDEAYLLMQSMQSLRPDVMQGLLEQCQSVKVKRLFMHFAELHQLPLLKHINTRTINFGKGKRVIAGGGVYHPKYQLSLPQIREDTQDDAGIF